MTTPSTPPPPEERRGFLQTISIALGGLASLALGLPVVSYLAGMLIRPRADDWIDLGPISDFPINETRLKKFTNTLRQPWDGMTANAAVYVRRTAEQEFTLFSIYCAHLGCPVSWFPAAGLFMCPCHGGVYYEDGNRASGPPPRGLYKYPTRIVNGRLQMKGGHLPTLQDTFEEPHNI